ncbi:unnamed protein product [Nippostrongylus brasiliensis]|uniref:gamma-glutamylcyclotransferase n=1 Tax=Nippostrongylus brasiliensis TaxID=27835 RepID=A0A0N4YGQ8_NIPBR|nr:unnamed protein product [Nippostrongylus brasiliensis]
MTKHFYYFAYGSNLLKERIQVQVHGCVWRVPEEFASELDAQEAVPIDCDGCMIECRTYQYSDSKASSQPPSPHYKTVIIAGAIENSLPSSYVKGIASENNNF